MVMEEWGGVIMTGEEEMDAWFTMRIDEPNRYKTELIVLRPASHIFVSRCSYP